MERYLTFGRKGRYGTMVYLKEGIKDKVRIGDIFPHEMGENVFYNNGNHLLTASELKSIATYVKLYKFEKGQLKKCLDNALKEFCQ